MNEAHISSSPDGRMSRILNDLLEALKAHSEHWETDKVILLMDDGSNGAIGMWGYDSARDSMTDMMAHTVALFAACGVHVQPIPVSMN